jgi:hypothetical protein
MLWGNQATFVQHWHFAQGRNSLDTKAMERILKAAATATVPRHGKADKFLNDLNAEIEQGWTGPGQTNRLLGRIAMRSYIFGHVLYTDKPLEGHALGARYRHDRPEPPWLSRLVPASAGGRETRSRLDAGD